MMREAVKGMDGLELQQAVIAVVRDHPTISPRQIETIGEVLSREGWMRARNEI